MSRIKRIERKTSKHWTRVLEEYMLQKTLQGISNHTYADYVRTINLLFKRYPDAWDSHISLERGLAAHLSQEGISPSTFNSLIAGGRICVLS